MEAPLLRRSVKSAPGMRRSTIPVRVTPEEKQQVALNAKAHGVSMSNYLLTCALHSPDTVTPAQVRELVEQLEAIRAHLGKVGSNLNQIARHANTTYQVPSDAAFVANEVYDVVNKINRVISGGGVPNDA